VAILGDAAGTTARAIGHFFPTTQVDAVEIDGDLTGIGERFFHLARRPGLRLITADARPWLAASAGRYDMIVIDAYRQPYIPFYLMTREFFASVLAHLSPGGVAIVNIGHPTGSDALERAATRTLGSVFRNVARDPMTPTNTLVAASTAPLSRARLFSALTRLPTDLRPVAAQAASRLTRGLAGGQVYTDDRAPVEWLIDSSLLSYATGHR
jgi:spermidine synthase